MQILKHNSDACHYYTKTGESCYEQPLADGSGTTPTTLRHARKLNLLPSVTTILKCVAKPGLERWKISQAVMAAMTSPRRDGEDMDAFIDRVLNIDREQDEEAGRAAELGKRIHGVIENCLNVATHFTTWSIINELSPEMKNYVEPAWEHLKTLGRCIHSEHIVVGNGYAGKVDAAFESDREIMVVDFKTTKTMPKESWPEARMQLSAYAKAIGNTDCKRIKTCNVYISTINPGEFKAFVHDEWTETFDLAFSPLMRYWQWLNNYYPKQ